MCSKELIRRLTQTLNEHPTAECGGRWFTTTRFGGGATDGQEKMTIAVLVPCLEG